MKLSDYVVKFLEEHGIQVVFGYQGSSVAHTIDSISKSSIQFVQTFHEQAAAFSACGYAQCKNQPAAALSCSGPGALNLVTGIADAWYDSLPCFFITGQVGTPGIRQTKTLRQLGFQETDIVPIVAPITKYAVTVMNPEDIRYQLERAWHAMTSGRRGPVVVDIPHNVQAAQIQPEQLRTFEPVREEAWQTDSNKVAGIAEQIQKAYRPLILLGAGARGLRGSAELEQFCLNTGVPVVCSYMGRDILNNDNPSYIGVVGAYGNRIANYAVQHCDLLLSIGSRMDGRQTGDDPVHFAQQAQVVQVDIDSAELAEKPKRYQKICMPCETFLEKFSLPEYKKRIRWLSFLQKWKEELSAEKEYPEDLEGVNPNQFLADLSETFPGAVYTLDVGQNQIWGNASLRLTGKAKLIQSGGLGAMGFALPAAVGAWCASAQDRCFCICGDGGFQMNLQELETVSIHKIPLCVIVMNNQSLGLIRVYQQKALAGNLVGSVEGFGVPDLQKLAQAYGFTYYRVENTQTSDVCLKSIKETPGPCVVEVILSTDSQTYPEPTYRQPVEVQSPLLNPETNKRMEEDLHETEC